jgi:hypothetical protein
MSADRWRPIENGRQRLSPPPPMHLLLPLLSGLQIGLGFGGVGLGGVGFGGVGLDGVGLGGVGLGGVGFGGVGLEGLLFQTLPKTNCLQIAQLPQPVRPKAMRLTVRFFSS